MNSDVYNQQWSKHNGVCNINVYLLSRTDVITFRSIHKVINKCRFKNNTTMKPFCHGMKFRELCKQLQIRSKFRV